MRPRVIPARVIPAVLFFLVVAAACPGPLRADPGFLPIPSLSPSRLRGSIVSSAESLIGTPYRFGGKDRKGLDCSGLVYLVFHEATGHSIPRTVSEQGLWVVIIPKRELQPGDLVFFNLDAKSDADHVGIYSVEGRFIHAASAGTKTGVTVNSLSEPAWTRRYLFAGRAVSASALSGLALDLGLGAAIDATAAAAGEFELRGAEIWAAVGFPLAANFSVGLQAGARWDSLLNAARFPLELVVGQISGFSIFAGPALTAGSPRLPASETGAAERVYTPVPAWIASAGIRWSPILLRSGTSSTGLFAEIRFDRYLPAPGQPENLDADRGAAISLGLGLRFRSIHY